MPPKSTSKATLQSSSSSPSATTSRSPSIETTTVVDEDSVQPSDSEGTSQSSQAQGGESLTTTGVFIFGIGDDKEVILEKQDVDGPLCLVLFEAMKTEPGKRYAEECGKVLTARKRRKVAADAEGNTDEDEDLTAMFNAAQLSTLGKYEPIEKQIAKISKHPGTVEVSLSVTISLQKISKISDLTQFDRELKNLKNAGDMAKLYKHMSYLLYPNLLENDALCEKWQNAKNAMGALCLVAFYDTPALLRMNALELDLLCSWWAENGDNLNIKKVESTWMDLLVAIRRGRSEAFPNLLEHLKNGK
ncbi:hypothetical protein HK104_001057 [Borealophlyctis nickersoniae]|nr:hypothetical protein HK104_001057 [Borealophlyctis nickersoniae]